MFVDVKNDEVIINGTFTALHKPMATIYDVIYDVLNTGLTHLDWHVFIVSIAAAKWCNQGAYHDNLFG